ncbi:MAG: molybdenum cofactor carrier protein [Acidobacteria bacterium]|nr:molybdenum cofactor carrier protein [Acidobacteriota bacterium]
MNPVLSDKTVGVMGSSRNPHDSLAGEIGRLLADLQVNLLTGGGGGVMEAVSRAFVQARRGRGVCIGIIPCSEADPGTPKEGYPNEFIELPIFTHLPLGGERGQDSLSRNHINVLSCAAIVVLPGSKGTLAEASLALRYRKPVIACLADDALGRSLPTTIRRAAHVEDVRHFLRECLSGVG